MSLGVGWRHLFSDQSVSAVTKHDGHQARVFEEGAFIGANLFVDMRGMGAVMESFADECLSLAPPPAASLDEPPADA